MYFLLGGRVLAHSFLRSAFTKPKVVKDAAGNPIPPKVTGPKWLSVASSLFRRSIRLALPAIAVGFLQWQLSSHQVFNKAIIAQGILKTDALWIPNWYFIGNFANFLQFCIDLCRFLLLYFCACKSAHSHQCKSSIHALCRLCIVDNVRSILGFNHDLHCRRLDGSSCSKRSLHYLFHHVCISSSLVWMI